MNRHERRSKKTARASVAPAPKMKITFHVAPESIAPPHLALLMQGLSEAFRLSTKMPGITYPIHLVVRQGDVNACGEVEPASNAPDGPLMLMTTTPCTLN